MVREVKEREVERCVMLYDAVLCCSMDPGEGPSKSSRRWKRVAPLANMEVGRICFTSFFSV
jgi:hypothetical protein